MDEELGELGVVRQEIEDVHTRRDDLFVALRAREKPVPWERIADEVGMSRMGVIKAHNRRVGELAKQRVRPA